MLRKLLMIFLLNSCLFSGQSYYEYGKKIELTPITQNKSTTLLKNNIDNNISIKYYKKSNTQIVGVADTIIAKCLDLNQCNKVIEKYTTLEFKIISKNTYLIKINNLEDIFDISTTLFEEGCFLYVHPNFYKEKKLR